MATAWSTEVLDTSKLPMPSVSTRTRSASWPRRMGREELGPKKLADTPGWRDSISPMVGRVSRTSASPSSTLAAVVSEKRSRTNGAETMISGEVPPWSTDSCWSSASTGADTPASNSGSRARRLDML